MLRKEGSAEGREVEPETAEADFAT